MLRRTNRKKKKIYKCWEKLTYTLIKISSTIYVNWSQLVQEIAKSTIDALAIIEWSWRYHIYVLHTCNRDGTHPYNRCHSYYEVAYHVLHNMFSLTFLTVSFKQKERKNTLVYQDQLLLQVVFSSFSISVFVSLIPRT